MSPTTAGRLLLREQGGAASSDSKSVRVFRFEVPEGVEALALRFDYAPRTCEDRALNAPLIDVGMERYLREFPPSERDAVRVQLKSQPGIEKLYRVLNNLMNVTLIDPTGRWRGRWDRNPSSDGGALLLGPRCASRGFLPGAIQAGTWQAAVECHIVVGDPVRYQLEVEARPASDLDALAARIEAAPRSSGRRAPGGRRWYFGEMHCHTVHSDGKHELADLSDRVRAAGGDFLFLTDHNAVSGLLERGPFPVTVLPGCELTTFHGHHPIYGLREMVPWHVDGRVRPYAEVAREVRAKGGIPSLAHPIRSGDPICTGCQMPDGLDLRSIQTMEVWYRGWESYEHAYCQKAYAIWNALWKQGMRVTALAARDWHGPGPFEQVAWPGEVPFTGIFAEDDSVEAILAGLRRGEVIMSGGPVLALEAESGGRRARIGGTLRLQGRARLELNVERLGGEGELRVFRSGALVHRQAVEADGRIVLDGLADTPGYYRAEIWRGRLPRVITNHLVLE